MLRYNNKADEFAFAVDDIEDELSEPVATESLEAITAMVNKFEENVKPRIEQLTEQYNEINAMHDELEAAGVEDAFSRYTLQDLYDKYIAVYGTMQSRETELQAENERQQGNEALQIAFAEVRCPLLVPAALAPSSLTTLPNAVHPPHYQAAEAVRHYCDATTASVGSLAGSLEDQSEALKAKQQEYLNSALLQASTDAQAALDEAGVVDNPKTGETVHSLNAMWGALDKVPWLCCCCCCSASFLLFQRTHSPPPPLCQVLTDADEAVQAQILAARDEHITPEQLKSIREVFEYFDQDKDKALSPSEFHSCCTGIGLMLTDDEVKAKVAEVDLDGDGVIDFEEFTAFMISRLVEPGHGKDDVMEAFVDLAEKEEYVRCGGLVVWLWCGCGAHWWLAWCVAWRGCVQVCDAQDSAAYLPTRERPDVLDDQH